MRQPWLCEACSTRGVVVVAKHADVMSVFYKIRDAHEKKSPDCGFDHAAIRVIAPKKRP